MAETELATRSGATPSASDQDYLPGAASMIEEVDKKVMIVLRDGRHLTGKLRSFDQFMNLILEDTYERVFLTGKFSDVPLGLYIVRGDTIVLMGGGGCRSRSRSSEYGFREGVSGRNRRRRLN